MTTPPTDQQLDEIETRAAHLHEYACQDDGEGDTLAGADVPLLLAEVRRLQGQRRYLIDQLARKDACSGEADEKLREFLSGQTDPDSLPAWLYQRFMVSGVGWDNLDADDRAHWEHQARAVRRAVARGGFKAVAPDAASEATNAPLRPSQPSSVSESAQSPTGAPEGALRPSLSVGASEICGKCKKPFDLADTSRDGHNRFYLTPYCRRCVDACHDTEIADHRCVICA